jgi:hypothetical protein
MAGADGYWRDANEYWLPVSIGLEQIKSGGETWHPKACVLSRLGSPAVSPRAR